MSEAPDSTRPGSDELDENDLESVNGGMSIGGHKHSSDASAGKGASSVLQPESSSGPTGGSSGGSPFQTGKRPA